MFAVPKYSQALEEIRKRRNVEGMFQHNLVAVDSKAKVATFKNLADGGNEIKREFDLLHVVPPQKPFDFVAKSALGKPYKSVNQR
jgi:eukaryotic sulfide quinone oxidoreductase